jgi:hypothetical protein
MHTPPLPPPSTPQAYLALEAAQATRKVSAPLRLASVALATLLGAAELAVAHFQ